MAIAIAVANQKGGSGKSTTVHALGDILSRRYNVLMVDCDAQASLTARCGLTAPTPTLAGILEGRFTVAQAIHKLTDTLSIVPSDMTLADIELELARRPGRELVLKRALTGAPANVILLDTPPGLSLITLNALTTATGVLVVCQPTADDLRGLALFLHTFNSVKREHNQALELIAILPTMYSAQLTAHADAMAELQASGYRVLQPIGRSVRVQESSAACLPITQYEPNNPRAQEYELAGREVIKWLRRNEQ
jgi:chromosome partitioning protein